MVLIESASILKEEKEYIEIWLNGTPSSPAGSTMKNLMNKCKITNTHVICNGIDVNGMSFEMTKEELDTPIIQLKKQIRETYLKFYD